MTDAQLIGHLRDIAGPDAVLTDRDELIAYSYDSQQVTALPDAMVLVTAEEQVAGIVRTAAEAGVPVTARGAGSGMTGGSVPERGGIVINTERMDRIISISTEDRIAHLEPGVVTGDFQKAAAALGLFYPPEPASSHFSTIGGNVAESAGGLGCVKYGLTKHFIAGLRFVAADGTVVSTGVYSDRESSIDLASLITGSEGMLGIVTRVAVRLIPLPEARVTFLALFRSLADTARASNAVLMSGVNPSVLEFMDRSCIDSVREYADFAIPEGTGALLIAEMDGVSAEVEAGRGVIRHVLEDLGPLMLRSADTEAERTALWKLRKSISPAIARIKPLKFNEDICVPLSQIPAIAEFVDGLGRRRDVRVVTFGHSGDGNLHVNIMADWRDPGEVARAKEAIADLFRETVRRGGTLSGEHGIGIAKRPYIPLELDEPTIAFERAVKRALDPGDILNPGKIFPE